VTDSIGVTQQRRLDLKASRESPPFRADGKKIGEARNLEWRIATGMLATDLVCRPAGWTYRWAKAYHGRHADRRTAIEIAITISSQKETGIGNIFRRGKYIASFIIAREAL